jgi:hypothetical protein
MRREFRRVADGCWGYRRMEWTFRMALGFIAWRGQAAAGVLEA